MDPQDTQPDLPPSARPVPGVAAKVSISTDPPPTSEPRPQSSPAATLPPPAPAEPKTTAVANSGSFRDQVDAYVRGEDHDRTQLYQSWSEVADYVVQGLRDQFGKGSVLVAPYLNLISNALNVIDDGKYLAPTLRPNWDQSVRSDRLSKKQGIPGFRPDDYRIVVESLCSPDEDVRRAAQRLLRVYPSSHFYPTLQALPKQPSFDRCRLGFMAETAAYYFYNRIVEYDGTFALDKENRAWIGENHADGTDWTKRGEVHDTSLPLFTAMLDYARGLVLFDHGDKKDALAAFNQMIEAIRTSGRIYPSNPQHIATALRLTQDPNRNAKGLQAAQAIIPPDRHPVAKAYVVSEGAVALFALPDTAAKTVGKMRSDTVAHVYLRFNNWDLVEGGGQIGWARRVIASAAR
jgi:hypothetical protein